MKIYDVNGRWHLLILKDVETVDFVEGLLFNRFGKHILFAWEVGKWVDVSNKSSGGECPFEESSK